MEKLVLTQTSLEKKPENWSGSVMTCVGKEFEMFCVYSTSFHVLWLPSSTGVTWFSFFLIYFSELGDVISDQIVTANQIHKFMRSQGFTMAL